MALLSRHLTPERVVFLRSRTREGAVRELAARLARTTPGIDAGRVVDAIRERESLVSSWVAPGVAIPHARLAGMAEPCVVVGRSRQGVAWDSGDGDPVRLVVLIASDDRDPDGHLQLLAEIARTLRDLALKQLVLTARSAAEVHRLLITHGYVESGPRPRSAGRVRLSRLLFAHALSVAEEVKARAVVLHGDAFGSLRILEDIPAQAPVILATADRARWRDTPRAVTEVLQVPFPTLSRLDQVELVLLFGLSRGLFARGDTVISLSGAPTSGFLDTLLVLDVGREFPAIFDAHAAGTLLGDVEPHVLEKLLQVAVDLAREGREGRPVGTIFVVGDHERVATLCRQMVINPFRGYRDEEKNVLDPSLGETLKEFSTIDGAFVVRGDGVILSAGTYLKTERVAGGLPAGLGARHAAAAAVTAGSAALAVVISQSTGTVSLFKGGVRVLALEKPAAGTDAPPRPRGSG